MGSELNDSCHNLQICFCGDVMAHLKDFQWIWLDQRVEKTKKIISTRL